MGLESATGYLASRTTEEEMKSETTLVDVAEDLFAALEIENNRYGHPIPTDNLSMIYGEFL